jgi:hypothetical protein
LKVVKCDDAKFEVVLFISSGDPDDHVHLLHVLVPQLSVRWPFIWLVHPLCNYFLPSFLLLSERR